MPVFKIVGVVLRMCEMGAGTVTWLALPVFTFAFYFRFNNESRSKAMLANCVAYLKIMHL